MAGHDIVDLLIDDHAEFRRIFADLDTAAVEDRGDLFGHIVSQLARHEAAEEAIVHSTIRDVPGGQAVAQAVLEEEDRAEKLMAQMEGMDSGSEEFLAAFQTLRKDVLAHAEHEERDEFPRLLEHLAADRRQSMADAFATLKRTAPTHPHPKTPQNPGVRAVVGPIAGVFDRARDAARDAFSS